MAPASACINTPACIMAQASACINTLACIRTHQHAPRSQLRQLSFMGISSRDKNRQPPHPSPSPKHSAFMHHIMISRRRLLRAEQCWVALWTLIETWFWHITCTDHCSHALADAVKSDAVHLVTVRRAFWLPRCRVDQIAHVRGQQKYLLMTANMILPIVSNIMTCSLVISWRSQQQLSSYSKHRTMAAPGEA